MRKYMNLCFEDERESCGFGTTWIWVKMMTEFALLGGLSLYKKEAS